MRAYAAQARVRAGRDQLIAEHAGMARRIALRVARNIPEWMSKDDLIAVAMVGLVEAADRFDETRGEPFVAFAERRVRGAVFDELRRGDILPRRKRTLARKVGAVIRDLEKKLARPPEDEEIAAELGIDVEEYRSDMAILSQVGMFELGAEEKVAQLALPDDCSPENQVARAQRSALVARALERMHERDVLVLSLYYIEELTLAEIGEVLGVSQSRVSQLHTRGLARLRAELDSEEV
jgi:RNA polymerase sigma factor for flagellar operon FliA